MGRERWPSWSSRNRVVSMRWRWWPIVYHHPGLRTAGVWWGIVGHGRKVVEKSTLSWKWADVGNLVRRRRHLLARGWHRNVGADMGCRGGCSSWRRSWRRSWCRTLSMSLSRSWRRCSIYLLGDWVFGKRRLSRWRTGTLLLGLGLGLRCLGIVTTGFFGKFDAGPLEKLLTMVPPRADGGSGDLPPFRSFCVRRGAIEDRGAVVPDLCSGLIFGQLAHSLPRHHQARVGHAVVQ